VRVAAAAVMMLASSAISDCRAAAPERQGRPLAELLRPRQHLESVEIYHIPDLAMYRASIPLEELITNIVVRDYARIRPDNHITVDSLYTSLAQTIAFENLPCETDTIDARWAIVLKYSDHTKEALGFNRTTHCVQLLSRKKPLAVTSGVLEFIDRAFGFMR
jgi:hypothetical protein